MISIVCGIVKATGGTVSAAGHDIVRDYRAARSLIGLVPQELTTDMWETVWSTCQFSRGLLEFKKARVAPDYHIQVEGHYYSVHFTLVKEVVQACVRPRLVQVFHRGRMVASHRRSSKQGQYTTLPEHMPPHHRQQAEWTPERFQSWALRCGAPTHDFVVELLKRRRHPQQAFRSCFGLMRLAEQFSKERLSAACLRAHTLGAYQYKSVKSILEKGLDKQPLPGNKYLPSAGHHENVRGAAYYSQLDLFSDN